MLGAVFGMAPLLAVFRRDGAAILFEGAQTPYDARVEYFFFLGLVVIGALAWTYLCRHSHNCHIHAGSPVIIGALSVMATAVAAIYLCTGGTAGPLGLVGGLLMGLAVALWVAVITPAWGIVLTGMERTNAMGVIAFSLVASLLPSTIGAFIDGALKPLVTVLPLLSGTLLLACFRTTLAAAKTHAGTCENPTAPTSNSLITLEFQRYPLFFAALVLLGGVIRGFLNNGSFINAHDPANNLTTHAVASVLVLSVFFVATRHNKASLGLRRAWGLLFVFLLGSLLLIAFLSVELAPLVPFGRSLVIAGNTCLTALFWALLVCMRPAGDPVCAVGRFEAYAIVGALAAFCSYLLTPAFAQYLGISLTNQVFGCSLATAFVLAIATFAFLGNGGLRETRSTPDPLAICQALAPSYGLTEREVQICALIAQGHTLDAVADHLGLAASTVRSYSKDLYRKLGVHKKQEIVDLVSRWGDA